MVIEYTKEECKALDYKFDHPDKKVLCPRCGKELIFTERGNSCEVRCETEGCLYDAIRGL
jgi:ribosomal protein S27E